MMHLRLFTKRFNRLNTRYCSTQDRAKNLPHYIPNLENQFVKLLKKSGNTKITVERKPNAIEITYDINPEIKEQVKVANDINNREVSQAKLSFVKSIYTVIQVASVIAAIFLSAIVVFYLLYNIIGMIEDHTNIFIGTCIGIIITAIVIT